MEPSNTNDKHRLKVEKGLERQALVLGLRLIYLGVYGVFFLLSILPLTNGVSLTKLVFTIVLATAFYMAAKYADDHDLLAKMAIQKFPNILVNDLYKIDGKPNQSE